MDKRCIVETCDRKIPAARIEAFGLRRILTCSKACSAEYRAEDNRRRTRLAASLAREAK